MAEQTIEDRLDELKQKQDYVGDIFSAEDIKTLVEAIEYAMSHGGDVSMAVTPVENGYKFTVTDSEGYVQEATVTNGGDAYEVYKSTVPEDQEPMSKNEWLASLKGDEGADAVNPFKGYFPNGATKPTTGQTGDYMYAPDSTDGSTTTIWNWDGTTFVDSGVEVDVSDVNDFAGGIQLNLVEIDNSGLDNPVNSVDSTKPVLADAKDVKLMKQQLRGVTLSEVKQTITDWYPEESSSGYYDSDGVWHTSNNYKSARFALADGDKRVRFIGFNKDYSDQYDYAYGFLDSDGDVIEDTFTRYKNTGMPWANKCEIVCDVPSGASYFVCLYVAWSTSDNFKNFTADEFYCYIASGNSVMDMFELVDKEIESISSAKKQDFSVGSVRYGFIRVATGLWRVSDTWQHGYVNVSDYRGEKIRVTNNNNAATTIAFVTAIDEVTGGATPAYVDGWDNVVYPADGELGGSEIYDVPADANYMYVYLGEDEVSMPEVELIDTVINIVEDMMKDEEEDVVPVRLFPLWTPWHIRVDNGVIDSEGDWEMFAHPVKAGDKLRLTATKNISSNLALVQYGFSVNYPSVGDTITATAIAGMQGEAKVVELTAESDGWFVFSGSLPSGGPTWSYTLEMMLPLSEVVSPKMSKGLEYGMRELHFTEALTAASITETYSQIHDLYDALVSAHGEAFERLADILANDGSDNEIRLYRLGFKNFGGLYTGYDFENPSANKYYSDPNDGNKSHEKKRILFNAGIHGDEKAAVYGLYYFCKSVLESNDAWAVYIKSNYIIDVIPIVSTKNYNDNSRTGTDDIDPNRNFGVRSLVQVEAASAFVDSHAGEYCLHVDCHNQANTNAKSKCFVGSVRGSKGFEDVVEFARRFSGIARGGWNLLPWYKPHSSDGTPTKVSNPMIVTQTNSSSELVADNYKMTYPSCTRVYGAISITMEAPRNLTNTNLSASHYDAAKLTADMLIELTRLADSEQC